MTAHFDEEIHAPIRLRMCGMLAAVKAMEFSALRDGLGVADSVVSKHLARLVEAGYVRSWKTTSAGRARVWAELTPYGRRAFADHVEALRQIAAGTFETAEAAANPAAMGGTDPGAQAAPRDRTHR